MSGPIMAWEGPVYVGTADAVGTPTWCRVVVRGGDVDVERKVTDAMNQPAWLPVDREDLTYLDRISVRHARAIEAAIISLAAELP